MAVCAFTRCVRYGKRQVLLLTSVRTCTMDGPGVVWNDDPRENQKIFNRFDKEIAKLAKRKQEQTLTWEDVEPALQSLPLAAGALRDDDAVLLLSLFGRDISNRSPKFKARAVEQILEILKNAGIQSISCYNQVLQSYKETEYRYCPTTFLKKLKSSAVQPNEQTIELLVARFADFYTPKAMIDAWNLVEEMETLNVKPTLGMLNSVAEGYAKIRDHDSVTRCLKEITSRGFKLSSATYLSLARGHASTGDFPSFDKALSDAEKDAAGVTIAHAQLVDLLRTASVFAARRDNDNFDRADVVLSDAQQQQFLAQVLDRIRSTEPSIQQIVGHTLVNLFLHTNYDAVCKLLCSCDVCDYNFYLEQLASAAKDLNLNIVENLCSALEKRLSSHQPTKKIALFFAELGQHKRSLQLLKIAHTNGSKFSLPEMDTLFIHAAQLGDFQAVIGILEWALSVGLAVDSDTLQRCVFSYGRISPSALAMRTKACPALNRLHAQSKGVATSANSSPVSSVTARQTSSHSASENECTKNSARRLSFPSETLRRPTPGVPNFQPLRLSNKANKTGDQPRLDQSSVPEDSQCLG